jgi:hypothetical protein
VTDCNNKKIKKIKKKWCAKPPIRWYKSTPTLPVNENFTLFVDLAAVYTVMTAVLE